ncbi:MAG: penicillin-binding protein 2 [Acidobacteria bacterium]|nr:penicillin-binding protein 2 [Acidobacteriota bacterium]
MHLHADSKLPSQRLNLLRYGIVAVAVLLLVGFWQLQVVRSDYYADLAERNHIRTLPLMAPRGIIQDREGRTLVDHVPTFSVILIREHVGEIRDALPAIARGLNLELAELESRLEEFATAPPYQPIVLKDEATLADIAFIEAHRTDLSELELLLMYKRRYPPNGFGAHLFGYVGETTAKEIAARGYRLGDVVGKMGVERHYNQILMGENGQRRVIVDSRGKEVEKLDQKKPAPGRPLRLTLDYDLQLAAEQAMQDRQGAVVALDPRSGDILAFLSRPGFDPNLFAGRIPPEQWRALTEDPAKPLLNRVTQAQLAPGSVFKVVVATAALEEGLFDRPFAVRCPGWANHYGRTFRCWRPEGHGVVGFHQALVDSCDVFFYQVGRQLGIERIARYARQFGLGGLTGIDLPGEEAGLIPSPEWKQRVQKQPWFDGETISVAIGQGPIMVTPLQLAYAIGGIASGGVFARPRLILEPGSQPVLRRVSLKPETLSRLTDALWGVVNENGTGALARLPEIDVAGKTGTAQLVSYDTLKRLGGRRVRTLTENAWFVGLAPRRNPEIVVAVLLEHGEHGAAAAPVAREVIKAYYDKKNRGPAPQFARGLSLAERGQ